MFCECCVNYVDYYGELLPGFLLARANKDSHWLKDGDWALIEGDTPTFIFQTTPVKDPTFGLSDDQIIKQVDYDVSSFDKFTDTADRISVEMYKSLLHESNLGYFTSGFVWARLLDSIKKAGWDEQVHGDPMYWLVHHIAVFLEANPKPLQPYVGANNV